jgi:hypothetical protein
MRCGRRSYVVLKDDVAKAHKGIPGVVRAAEPTSAISKAFGEKFRSGYKVLVACS